MEVDSELASSYSKTFDGSDASNAVLKDLISLCGYGMYSDDEGIKNRIMERSAVIFRIKQMLNGLPTEQEDDEYE